MSRSYVRNVRVRTVKDVALSLVIETPSTVDEMVAVSKKSKSSLIEALIALESEGVVKRNDFYHHSGQVVDIWSWAH